MLNKVTRQVNYLSAFSPSTFSLYLFIKQDFNDIQPAPNIGTLMKISNTNSNTIFSFKPKEAYIIAFFLSGWFPLEQHFPIEHINVGL